MLGELSQKYYIVFIEKLLNKDAASCLKFIDEYDQKGASYIPLVERLASLVRHGFVMGVMGQKHRGEDLWELEEEDLLRLEDLARNSKNLELNRLFRLLAEALEELSDSFLDRYTFENICLEWCLGSGAVEISNNEVLPKESLQKGPEVVHKSLMTQFKKKVQEPSSESAPTSPSTESSSSEQIAPASKTLQLDRSFPDSWKALLERWKQIKPLQARKLEELVALEYSREKITLLVREGSLVGPTLLQKETQNKVARVLAKLFDFHGFLQVREESPQEKDLYAKKNPLNSVPESVLDEKNRLYEEEKQKRLESLKNNPLTQKLCETFEGRIVETHIE